jgi:hypothetical protein
MRKLRQAKVSAPKGGDCIGFDVITSRGSRVGVVEDVYRCSGRGIGTCMVLARKIPGAGMRRFILPLKRVAFDPVQYCFVWNEPAVA